MVNNSPRAKALRAFREMTSNSPQTKQAAQFQASGVIQRVTITDIPTAEARFTAWALQTANRPLETEDNAAYIRRFNDTAVKPADSLSIGMMLHLSQRLTIVKAANAEETARHYVEACLPTDGLNGIFYDVGLTMSLDADRWRVGTTEGYAAFNAIATDAITAAAVRDRFFTWVSANPRQATATAAHLLAFRNALWADNHKVITQEALAFLQWKYADVAGLAAGKIQDAAVALSCSPVAIDRNTAAKMVAGTIVAYYMEDLAVPPDANARLLAASLDPTVYTVYLDPVTGNNLFAARNFIGFAVRGTNRIFGLRTNSLARWSTLLVHETNHNVNADPGGGSIAAYKGEFRAYWVAEFRHVADLDMRAAQVKAHILRDYPAIKANYDTNAIYKGQVDAHTRPDGNVDNT
ncbi:MAG: hypothetical protein GY950_32310 [bacterium]|nr:hypothetical protein [bacterium]